MANFVEGRERLALGEKQKEEEGAETGKEGRWAAKVQMGGG